MKLKLILIGLMIFMFGGCIDTTSIKRAQWLAGDGYSEEYYRGFADGCDYGLRVIGVMTRAFRVDIVAYNSKGTYTSGWEAGRDRCVHDEKENERKQKEADRKADEMNRQWREYKLQQALDKYLDENKK